MVKNTQSVSVQVGPGFVGLLTLLFVGLKLTGYVTWSWWWVFSPMIIAGGFAVVILLIALLVIIAAG